MIPYVLVTGNAGKLEEARRILGPSLAAVALDLSEIQSLDPSEILRAKAEEAWRRIGCPVLVEETSLELAALGGFPGPLVKWMLAAVGAAGISRTALALGDPRVQARCSVLAWDGEQGLAAEGLVAGRLVSPPRGEAGFGWDPIFVPEGEQRTFAELPAAVKDGLSPRGRALRALADAIRRRCP